MTVMNSTPVGRVKTQRRRGFGLAQLASICSDARMGGA
jgi:hypothetical protein